MAKVQGAMHKDVILSSAGITASLVLADPTIFLSGFSRQDQAESPPALVRGSLLLRVSKAAKIKGISLNFKGISRTDWPEGIPSDKSETHETKEVFAHEWKLFSAQFSNAEKSSGAHSVFALDLEQNISNADSESIHPSVTTATSHELVNQHEAILKGYRVFNPAEYVYNFELMLPQRLPETLKCNFGQVRWGFNLCIERHGTFKPNLTAHKEVPLLRTLGPSNLEGSEPIVINRDWEDILHYEIIIAGKAFAIGQRFNVAFALVPLAKVKCHRIRVYITEHTEYFCRNHRIHRVEPSHKFLLMERKSPDGNRGDLLKTAGQGVSGLTEFEFNIEIPETFPSRRDYLRPNANTEYIKVYHWIKAVMRLSRHDNTERGDAKCYEVSVDSPITLVDPRTSLASDLPDYDTARRRTSIADALKPYREFIQIETSADAVRNAETTNRTAQANAESVSGSGSERAILFARQPSIAPPPFDADVHPPELLPPQYDLAKEDKEQYERRYEEYLIGLGRLPPHNPASAAQGAALDNTSDSSTLSQSSDNGSGLTANTALDDAGAPPQDVIAKSSKGSPEGENSMQNIHSGSPTVNLTPTKKSPKLPASRSDSLSQLEQRAQLASSQGYQVPVFSEIIWSEDNPPKEGENLIDPQVVASSIDERKSDSSSTSTGSPSLSSGAKSSVMGSPTSSPNIFFGLQRPSSPGPVSRSASPVSRGVPVKSTSVTDNSIDSIGPKNIPKRRSSSRPNVFSPPRSFNQLMRSSYGTSAGSAAMSVGSAGANLGLPSARRLSAQGPRLSLKTGSAQSPGSPQSTSRVSPDSEAPQLFAERWMDRSDSTGSLSSPRYFRQSSVVSMDVTRQGVKDGAEHRDSIRGSRRPSRVSEIEEIGEWPPASRRNSDTSVAISVAEYQGLHPERYPARTPLLGDEESEMDIGLEWEYDYVDSGIDNDRSSVVSAFYTVLTP